MMPEPSSTPEQPPQTLGDSSSVSGATLLTSPDGPPRDATLSPPPVDIGSTEGAPGDVVGRIGRYPVLGEIGRGGMGAVWRGRDPLLGRELAIKVLRDEHAARPDLVRRFLEEAKIGGRLQHPGAVPVYELGDEADASAGKSRPYFTMKLIEGRTLALLLRERRDPSRDLPLLFKIFEQVCQTLAYAHARGILHRDLKPANVMVGAFGEVQVMDWGLAKILAGAGDASRRADEALPEPGAAFLTGAGTILGTPAYMPPEQARGEPLDERADVFGLGAILCEILTGLPPYTEARGGPILEQAQRGDVRAAFLRLEECGADADLVGLAKDCLAPRSADRPRHAGVVAERTTVYLGAVQERLRAAELERAAAQARAEEARAKAAAERRARRLTVMLAASFLLTVLGGTAAALWVQHDRATRAAQEMTRQAEQARKESETVQAISLNLEQAREELDRGRHASALVAARKAEGLLAGGGKSLQPRIEEILADLAMLSELEDIRLAMAELTPDQRGSDATRALPRYEQAFAAYRFPVLTLEVRQAAESICRRAIRAELVATLDNWAALTRDKAVKQRLFDVAQAADPDPRGVAGELRQALARPDPQALGRLLFADERMKRLPSATLTYLAFSLLHRGDAERAVQLLRAGWELHPGDFWLNYYLAFALSLTKPPRDAEAVRYFTAAAALRGDNPLCHYNLGVALYRMGRQGEAETAFRKARDLKPDYAAAHANLAAMLAARGEIRQAVTSYKEAIRRKPDDARLYYDLGDALLRLGELAEAIAACERAIALKPDYAEPHVNKGLAHLQQGQFTEGMAELKKGSAMLSRADPRQSKLRDWLREAESQARLLDKLPAILKGEARPADNAERVRLAQLCQQPKRLFAAAARLYGEALAAEPSLGENPQSGLRYNAACAAALAAAGQGADAASLDDNERGRWRRQTHNWLQADLTAWGKRLESGSAAVRTQVRETLRHWQEDADLAGVRESAALAGLAEAERQQWRKLWADVAELCKKAGK